VTLANAYDTKEETMPFVNIRITREQTTPAQIAELIRGVTQLLFDVLGKDPQMTSVIIDEVDTDNWGVAGESVTVRRERFNK
jgi:4-oxalocrotonate tautomerase